MPKCSTEKIFFYTVTLGKYLVIYTVTLGNILVIYTVILGIFRWSW